MGQIVQKQLKVDFAQFDPWGRGWVRDWSKVWYKQILTFNWTHEGKVEWLTEAKSGWTEVEWPTDAKCLATSVHPTLCLSQSLNHSLMGHIVPNEPWVVFAQFNPWARGRVTDWSKVWGKQRLSEKLMQNVGQPLFTPHFSLVSNSTAPWLVKLYQIDLTMFSHFDPWGRGWVTDLSKIWG